MPELDHERYMRRAIALAVEVPELPFGAVIVLRGSGEIVAEGWNKSAINPTWHGEIDALNALFQSDHRFHGSELVLYTTAEPCPMCIGAILWSGIEMVVFGSSIQFLQSARLATDRCLCRGGRSPQSGLEMSNRRRGAATGMRRVVRGSTAGRRPALSPLLETEIRCLLALASQQRSEQNRCMVPVSRPFSCAHVITRPQLS